MKDESLGFVFYQAHARLLGMSDAEIAKNWPEHPLRENIEAGAQAVADEVMRRQQEARTFSVTLTEAALVEAGMLPIPGLDPDQVQMLLSGQTPAGARDIFADDIAVADRLLRDENK